jgi:hypothetical protein
VLLHVSPEAVEITCSLRMWVRPLVITMKLTGSALTVAILVFGAVTVAWFLGNRSRFASHGTTPTPEVVSSSLPTAPEASVNASSVKPVTAVRRDEGSLPARSLVAPGSRAWRFDKPDIGTESAGSLYSRLAQRDIDMINAGDAARFAEVMRRCRHRSREQKLLEHERARSAQGTDFEKRATELLEESVREAESLCADAPALAAARSDEWLTRAAELGHPMARYYYASGRLGFPEDIGEVYKKPERLVEYKAKSLEYLQELALAGHYDSMVQLSSMFIGPMLGPDVVMSWAYIYAASLAAGDTEKQSRFLRQLESFSPEQRARAQREADRVFAACCR